LLLALLLLHPATHAGSLADPAVNGSRDFTPPAQGALNGAAPRIKYVNADADPADPRADGSIAHPYHSLITAANGAHDGDFFILSGSFSGSVVFTRSVTVQGGSADQTQVRGTMVFSGSLASQLRDVRVDCATDSACVSNSSARGADLLLNRVTINQGGAGPAAEAQTGRLIAARCDLNNSGSGPVVSLIAPVAAASRLDDCRLTGTANAQGLRMTVGGVAITGGAIRVSGSQPAVSLTDSELWISGASLSSGSVPLSLNSPVHVMVRDSTLAAGAGAAAVGISNGPIYVFGAVQMFLNNQFITDAGVASIACDSDAALISSGNYNSNNLNAPASQQFSGACIVTVPATF
jgi:hypothetical protein